MRAGVRSPGVSKPLPADKPERHELVAYATFSDPKWPTGTALTEEEVMELTDTAATSEYVCDIIFQDAAHLETVHGDKAVKQVQVQ